MKKRIVDEFLRGVRWSIPIQWFSVLFVICMEYFDSNPEGIGFLFWWAIFSAATGAFIGIGFAIAEWYDNLPE